MGQPFFYVEAEKDFFAAIRCRRKSIFYKCLDKDGILKFMCGVCSLKCKSFLKIYI